MNCVGLLEVESCFFINFKLVMLMEEWMGDIVNEKLGVRRGERCGL